MCICDKLPEVTLSHRSIAKLMQLEGVLSPKIVRRIVIEERPIVLVQGIAENGLIVHHVLCPGDVCYRKEKRTLEDGTHVRDRVGHDTYHCTRKEQFRSIVLAETVAEYRHKRFSYDPERLIMDIFARVHRGDYLGEFSPGIIYVQEVAEILSRIFLTRPGLLTAKTFCMLAMRKRRYASSRPTFFLSLGFPLEKAMGHLEADNTVTFVPLTEKECRIAAFFEDTYALIEKLMGEKRLSLHGMILCPPFPDEIADCERVMLPLRHPALIYARDEGDCTLQVQRHFNPERATVCIFRRRDAQPPYIVSAKLVHPLCGAEFGPDVEDVALWDSWLTHYVKFDKMC